MDVDAKKCSGHTLVTCANLMDTFSTTPSAPGFGAHLHDSVLGPVVKLLLFTPFQLLEHLLEGLVTGLQRLEHNLVD